MTFFVYILESELDNSFYVGQTANLEERLSRHNKGYNRSTSLKRPWKMIYYETCKSRSEAMKLEKRIKSWKKREAIVKYIESKKI